MKLENYIKNKHYLPFIKEAEKKGGGVHKKLIDVTKKISRSAGYFVLLLPRGPEFEPCCMQDFIFHPNHPRYKHCPLSQVHTVHRFLIQPNSFRNLMQLLR